MTRCSEFFPCIPSVSLSVPSIRALFFALTPAACLTAPGAGLRPVTSFDKS